MAKSKTKSDRRRKHSSSIPEEAPQSSSSDMVNVRSESNRRRKRSSDSSSSTPSSWLPLLILAAVAFSLFVSITDTESVRRRNVDAANDQKRRRFLLNAIEEDATEGGEEHQRRVPDDIDFDDNVWRRQLKIRQNRMRREQRTSDNVWSRAAAALRGGAGDEADAYGGPRSGRRMQQMDTLETWPQYEGKHRFDECVGKSIAQCQTLIDAFVTSHPIQFNNRTTLLLDVRKIRELTDVGYYKVVLRTDMDGKYVNGIFEDGQVFYPWPWTVHLKDTEIGPWDCANLEVADCCTMIQQDVQDPDDEGNFMACFVEEPVGTKNNPELDFRAITIVNAKGTIIRSPIAH